MVSIVVPCYNSQSYIASTIKSVLQQSYSDWELIIVDDCSDDNSLSIIQNFVRQDARIKCFKTFKSSGSPVLPRNIGIEKANGRYIAFLDSDDIWLPNKLENQLKMFKRHGDMAISFTNYEKISEDGKRNARIIKAPIMITYKELLFGNVIGCSTAVYDTMKVGKVYFQNYHHEDYILWLDILKCGYVARNSNSVEALYRVRNHSVSSNKIKALSWQWNIYRNIEKVGLLRSFYYFINYAYKAFRKTLV